ncbi:MAG: hypothetical protein HOG03_24950 [Desulfobacula sp.]|jgi:hypothetical protein|uniref:hypothetical protein n=1 Tax=Desulfobacula sp. TaxID=2593537 RepID=UPI001DBCB296|nr:hypothetical protein [Desulfobacula sp.]MBT3488014.1 hypothetical protein [Desulfobacula sp.]MBT3807810.1 hypothetical protein [Desulfobacula sp.]MBT4025886.1 hypothetical protein [Desulfobacula sp.]MBT4201423.1 hypothetical protein [Desulfobacula sp.]
MTTQNTDSLSANPPKEEFCIRCPRLGHQINFSYCSSENSGLPCFKTLDCWYSYFDVHAHLKDKLTKEEFQKAFLEKGKPKVLSLFDLIEQAKKRKGKQI